MRLSKKSILVVLVAVALIVLAVRLIPVFDPGTPTVEVLQPRINTLTMSVIDVGQGDSILVEFPTGETMLVDAGSRHHGRTVVDYLKEQGVSRIDILVASHPHEDHIGGMVEVLDAFPVGKVWDSGYVHGSQAQQRFLETIEAKSIRFGKPRAGFTESIGDISIKVLHPPTDLLSGTTSDANNNSLVLKVTHGSVSFLLTGDIEERGREAVRKWQPATVLKVSHHGAHNGTDDAFLRQVTPEIAVISCGRDNPYGHPNESVLEALKGVGAKTYTTAESGTIALTSDGNDVTVRTLGGSMSGAEPPNLETYVGNKNSKVFHEPTCSALPAEHNRVGFTTRQDAVDEGYRPCGRCRP